MCLYKWSYLRQHVGVTMSPSVESVQLFSGITVNSDTKTAWTDTQAFCKCISYFISCCLKLGNKGTNSPDKLVHLKTYKYQVVSKCDSVLRLGVWSHPDSDSRLTRNLILLSGLKTWTDSGYRSRFSFLKVLAPWLRWLSLRTATSLTWGWVHSSAIHTEYHRLSCEVPHDHTLTICQRRKTPSGWCATLLPQVSSMTWAPGATSTCVSSPRVKWTTSGPTMKPTRRGSGEDHMTDDTVVWYHPQKLKRVSWCLIQKLRCPADLFILSAV